MLLKIFTHVVFFINFFSFPFNCMSIFYVVQIDVQSAFNASSYELLYILNIPFLICFLYVPFQIWKKIH